MAAVSREASHVAGQQLGGAPRDLFGADMPRIDAPKPKGSSQLYQLRVFFLSDEAELLCIDSRRMSFRAARRIVIRCRRPDSDTLDVVMFNHKHAPELPDGVRRVDRLVGRAQLVRIDPADLFELAERRSHERNTF